MNAKPHIEITTPQDKPRPCYLLDQCILDTNKMTLVDSTNHQIISQDEKLINALILLVQRYPDLVTKDELMKCIWPNVIVTEWSITRFIADTRRLLGENHHIKTVHGRGYRYTFRAQEISYSMTTPVIPGKTGIIQKIKQLSTIQKIGVTVLSVSILAIGICSMAQYKKLPTSKNSSVAMLPMTIENDQEAWRWGGPALLKEKLEQGSVNTVNFSQVRHEYELWKSTHPDAPVNAVDFKQFCDQLKCSKIIIIQQSGMHPVLEFQYRIVSKDEVIISKGFEGNDIYECLNKLWKDLSIKLKISDTPIVNTYNSD